MAENTEKPVAIITGAGRGIGRAAAVELSRRGYRLVLVSRTKEQLEETRALVREAVIEVADVADPAAAGRIVARAIESFGRIDALVNNAGYAPLLTIDQVTPEEWRRIVDVNLSGALWLSQAAWPTFRRQKAGAIVNISSLSGQDPFPGLGYYGAAKAGLNLLGLVLGREGEPIGVRVYTLVLGAVETAMLRGLFSEEQVPPGAVISPEDVAAAIGQCIAGELRYTIGQTIVLRKSP